MTIASAIGRFAGLRRTPSANRPTDGAARMALLARAMDARHSEEAPPEVPRTRSQMAADFSTWMRRAKGVDITGMNEGDARKLDSYIDLVRTTGSAALDGRRREEAVAWIGERLRREINLSWSEDGLVTDGRLAFDPAEALRARLESADAPTVRDALFESYTRFEREVFDATVA